MERAWLSAWSAAGAGGVRWGEPGGAAARGGGRVGGGAPGRGAAPPGTQPRLPHRALPPPHAGHAAQGTCAALARWGVRTQTVQY